MPIVITRTGNFRIIFEDLYMIVDTVGIPVICDDKMMICKICEGGIYVDKD